MVTDRPGLLLGILTADCAPVLLADAEAGVIGAAHAGWRGALAGVTDATIAAMEAARGAARTDCRGGRPVHRPAVLRSRRGLSHAVRRNGHRDNSRFFAEGPCGQAAFRPWRLCRAPAQIAAGIGEVEVLNLDTYAEADRFYSYRRATHRGEADYGRQASLIGLPRTST